MNRLISGPETAGGTGEDGGVAGDDAPASFSSANRAWFTGGFAAPTEAQRGATPGRPSPSAGTRRARRTVARLVPSRSAMSWSDGRSCSYQTRHWPTRVAVCRLR
ncbi:hypothetical protein BEK98_37065 [Streptomyces diastatochromogenes]|uniref:Uncharacterized protein n=1 Tax=Streptomyces diastatochromogenes TaxID=42236 RepID=A0A233S220_STRDA|nr:hypothetical protein BEK98_37065 [Streptomyces diastatochromogenes]